MLKVNMFTPYVNEVMFNINGELSVKEIWPFLYGKLVNKLGQDFLGREYSLYKMKKQIWSHISIKKDNFLC